MKVAYNILKAGEYLVDDDETSIEDMVNIILTHCKANKTNGFDSLVDVEGVTPWEHTDGLSCREFLKMIRENHYLYNMKCDIDEVSVNIYIDEGDDKDPIHICYWIIDEVEEDASVALSMCNAIQLYYTDRKELLTRLGLTQYLEDDFRLY